MIQIRGDLQCKCTLNSTVKFKKKSVHLELGYSQGGLQLIYQQCDLV